MQDAAGSFPLLVGDAFDLVMDELGKQLLGPVAGQLPQTVYVVPAGLLLGFRAANRNCNGIGTVHGGVLMAFADYAATMVALSGVRENCATISFTSDFLGAARLGDWVEGRAEVIRRTGSMTFVRGHLAVADELVLSFQTVMRRLKKPDQ